eukprot:s5234_g2.t1
MKFSKPKRILSWEPNEMLHAVHQEARKTAADSTSQVEQYNNEMSVLEDYIDTMRFGVVEIGGFVTHHELTQQQRGSMLTQERADMVILAGPSSSVALPTAPSGGSNAEARAWARGVWYEGGEEESPVHDPMAGDDDTEADGQMTRLVNKLRDLQSRALAEEKFDDASEFQSAIMLMLNAAGSNAGLSMEVVTGIQTCFQRGSEGVKRAGQLSRSGFSEASKVAKCPEPFGNSNSSEDQAAWLDFSFSFKQWLFYADAAFENDVDFVEKHLEAPVSFTDTAEGTASELRAKKLFAILSGLLLHRPLKILKQVPNNNGLEVWRQLTSIFIPKTKTRALGILIALMWHPAVTKEKTLLEQIHGLQRLADAYQKASGQWFQMTFFSLRW